MTLCMTRFETDHYFKLHYFQRLIFGQCYSQSKGKWRFCLLGSFDFKGFYGRLWSQHYRLITNIIASTTALDWHTIIFRSLPVVQQPQSTIKPLKVKRPQQANTPLIFALTIPEKTYGLEIHRNGTFAEVAIKVIDIREIKEKYVVRNLHREARIMSTLNHPCIASLFQTMQLADNTYYLVTELVSGGDLCSFIIGQRYGKLEERPARVYARQFASALAHMHSYGIVHRDLKMENVMLNSGQTQIKIVDFGLSNVWTSDNPLRTHCGSPEYAAPELFIAGKEYGPEVDLWSLGIIFYGMVVGQLPFVGGRKNQLSSQERRKKLVAEISKGLGTTQRQAVGPTSQEFRIVLHKLLTTDPAKRITSKELLIHPWITEKGRKFVQTHPLKKITNDLQAKFINEIRGHFQADKNTILTEISKTPYGRYGGMFNMLAYKFTTEHFNPENIAPNVTHDKTESPAPLKNLTKPKSAPLTKSHHTLYNQCIVLLNKVSKQQIEQRAKTANPAVVLSKNVTRLSRTKIDHLQTKLTATKPNYAKTNSLTINRKIQENRPASAIVKRSDQKALSGCNNSDYNKQQYMKRPHTSENTRTVPRPPKRSSVLTATPVIYKPNSRDLQQRQQVRIHPDGAGDANFAKKATVQKPRIKHPLANDPIAKSIAGYLLKNIPEHMFH